MDRRRFRARNLLLLMAFAATPALADDAAHWRMTAARVTITRDDRGVAHVVGKSDADAVFGAIYAQAEDDFPRIEANYLIALGRTAEADGEGAIWADLRQRLYADPADLQARYDTAPGWLRELMTAWADGLNFYLATHPQVRPKVLTRFEPWMALSFTEGSIGGDIERISLPELAAFYGNARVAMTDEESGRRPVEPNGSNGIAIAPKLTAAGHALLLINPHTSFYFRSELQMTSEEGLNAYGASTWGQFFIYQGFNERAGWMHTSSGVDAVDEFAETVRRGPTLAYRYGTDWKPLDVRPITIAFRRADGSRETRTFTTYRTVHGPVVAERGGKWIAEALVWKPVPALEQSWLRTKAGDLAAYLKVAERQANSSNDTIFADAKGEIAYLHPQFVPVRDDRFDYTRLVDGSDPATAWRGLTPLAKLPQVIDPSVGWVKNTNNWPWTAAGPDSPRPADFPRYMDQAGENPRGLHADRLLKDVHGLTPQGLIALAYDPWLPAFATLIPLLESDRAALPATDRRRAALAEPIALLKGWDDRWSKDSTATSLAVFWGDALAREYGPQAKAQRLGIWDMIPKLTPDQRLHALTTAVEQLKRDFGDWRVPWGRINRFQRLDGAIQPHFDDTKPSIAVPFTSAIWGSLASFGARAWPGTKNYYGTSGNSFVAVVEFGPRVRAWSVSAGGESGDPASPHFSDRAQAYADGALQPVPFYPDELARHTERRYHPGESR